MSHRTPILRRLRRLNGRDLRVLGEALLTLALASAAIAALPFRRTARLMAGAGSANRVVRPEAQDKILAHCRWAVTYWADRVPWRCVCFQRGLTLHLMLRRRGIASILHYGVAQDRERGLHAHVWVETAGRLVMGGEQAAGYALVASFPAARN